LDFLTEKLTLRRQLA